MDRIQPHRGGVVVGEEEGALMGVKEGKPPAGEVEVVKVPTVGEGVRLLVEAIRVALGEEGTRLERGRGLGTAAWSAPAPPTP